MTLRITTLLKVTWTIAIVATGFTGVAQARGHGPALLAFDDLDLDGDGEITVAEMETTGGVRFGKVDTDSDGLISGAELVAFGQDKAEKRAAVMIEKFDTDKDGKLSAQELEARGKGRGGKFLRKKMVKHFDKDGNGTLSKDEYKVAVEKMQKRSGGKKKKNKKKRGQ
jgi:hypothetical protein